MKHLNILLAVLIVLSCIPYVAAETNTNNDIIYVSTKGNDNNTGLTPETSKKSIKNALNTVKSGGTIHIKPGTYKETLTIDKYVNMVGEGPKKTIINGNYENTCINIKPWNKVLIEGITITKGYGHLRGGGIYNDRSTAIIKNCIISNSKVWWKYTPFNPMGSGIYSYYGNMIIENSNIENNEISTKGGGISSIHSTLVIKDSIIQNNFSLERGSEGGGIYVYYGSIVVEDTIIRNNYASCGGGLGLENTHATFKNCIIQNNTAYSWGGGIYSNYNCVLTLDDKSKKQCINNTAPNYPNIF